VSGFYPGSSFASENGTARLQGMGFYVIDGNLFVGHAV
jgi:hypothetical protein